MPRIIVFIDESGTPVKSEKLFSCGAVWCMPRTWKGCQQPLRYTVDEMRKLVADTRGRMPAEIKYHDHSDAAENLIEHGVTCVGSDCSITQSGHPWVGSAIAFGSAYSLPATEKALHPDLSDSALGNQIRLSSVVSLLRPLIVYKCDKRIDVDIVLDSDVWRRSIEKFDPGLVGSISNSLVSATIHYEKSVSVPGLQMADLIAGMNRGFLLHEKHPKGHDFIQKRLLRHITFKEKELADY